MRFRHVCIFGITLSVLGFWSIPSVLAQATTTTTTTINTGTIDITGVNPEKSGFIENSQVNQNLSPDGTYERGLVQDVRSSTQQSTQSTHQLRTYVIQYLSGSLKGKTTEISSDVTSNPYDINPMPGDKVLIFLQIDPETNTPIAFLEGFDRRNVIYGLLLLFIVVMVLLAGWQGLKTVASMVISVALIVFILIPSFLKGLNPIPIAFVLSAIFSIISSVFAMGWNRKSFVTVIGTLGGTCVAFIIASLFADWAHLGGLSSEEDRLFFSKNPNLNAQGLLFAGVIIASMGIVEDVAVSIASGVLEVRQANLKLGFKELFRSGMVIGRDHMTALANTLIFAYVGASLSTLLLYSQYGESWAKFLNFDSVVDEIIRSMAGTIGLVFTVPITALLAAWFALRSKKTFRDPIKQVTGYRPKDTV
ncbi:YibE/F family protein [Candidatus Uhrbacteria bacterium]|nr:YibE/F family protein [Candidatus Uhrbacteria bacterium]